MREQGTTPETSTIYDRLMADPEVAAIIEQCKVALFAIAEDAPGKLGIHDTPTIIHDLCQCWRCKLGRWRESLRPNAKPVAVQDFIDKTKALASSLGADCCNCEYCQYLRGRMSLT